MLTLYALNTCRECLGDSLERVAQLAEARSTSWRLIPLTTTRALSEFKKLSGAEHQALPACYDSERKEFIDV